MMKGKLIADVNVGLVEYVISFLSHTRYHDASTSTNVYQMHCIDGWWYYCLLRQRKVETGRVSHSVKCETRYKRSRYRNQSQNGTQQGNH
jgi:hypothetical protein